MLAEHLHKPSIAKARNATEAMGILLKEVESGAEAELISRRFATAAGVARLCEVKRGDFTLILPTLPQDVFDLIIADLPYGIGADTSGYRSRSGGAPQLRR